MLGRYPHRRPRTRGRSAVRSREYTRAHGPGHHVPQRLRPRRRLRRRVPRRDRPDRFRRPRDRRHARHPAPRRALRRARPAPRAAVLPRRRARRRRRSRGGRGAPRRRAAVRRGGPHPRRPGQRPAAARGEALRRRGRGDRDQPVDAPPRADRRHLPWPRRLRAGRRPSRERRAARGGGRAARRVGARRARDARVAFGGRRPRRARGRVRPVRQRDARHRARRRRRARAAARPPGVGQRRGGTLRHHVRRRPVRAAAALRGLLPLAGARGEPRLGGRPPRPAPRRRGAHQARGRRVTRLGTPRLHLRETTSTNDRARTLAAAGAPHGTLVTAGSQSAGRGRQGRAWSAPPGRALLMSLVLRAPDRMLPLAAAVAVADAAGPGAAIKWPNDVLLEDRKVAGILAEARPQEGWAVLGIGLNAAVRVADLPPELRDTAATLGLEPRDVETVLTRLLAALERALALDTPALLDAWRARDALRGREVAWAGGRGRAAGIDGDGRLVVELAHGGRTALEAGGAPLRPPPS